jgi:hypothetical protein
VKSFLKNMFTRESEKCKWRQKDKFDRLKSKQRSTEKGVVLGDQTIKDRWVINKSSRQLSEHEHKLLQRGLKFAVTPNKLPVFEFITTTEEACAYIRDPKTAESLRGEIVKAVKSAHPPRPNITKQERRALNTLKKEKDIMILPADKGCATVVLDRSEYIAKMEGLVKDTNTYSPLPKDPTEKFRTQLVNILKEWKEEIPGSL